MFNNLATLSFSALLFISLAACSGANSKTPAKVFDARNEVGHVFVLQTIRYLNSGAAQNYAYGDMTFEVDQAGNILGQIYCNKFSAFASWSTQGQLVTSAFQIENKICPGKPLKAPFNFTTGMKYSWPTATQLQIGDASDVFTATFLRN